MYINEVTFLIYEPKFINQSKRNPSHKENRISKFGALII